MGRALRVALIGTKFMGKAHSNAWGQVNRFFKRDVKATMAVICGRDAKGAQEMADTWGWEEASTDWRDVVSRPDIDLVDICTPNNNHAEIAIAALKAGKHVACEKPLAMNVQECQAMTNAAQAAQKLTFVWYNYRRVPALALARQLVQEGRIGRVYHVRCVYLQSWIMDPKFPLVWRLQSSVAGSGPHGDLNAHIIDAARFITGEEVTDVTACFETFIKERPVAALNGNLSAKSGRKMGKVTVEDAALLLGRLSGGGVCSFEATRFAQGCKNGNGIEINGEKGALRFEFEDMNRLKYYDASRPAHVQGWTDILATDGTHPYFPAYWPAGHIIGYEHTFINCCADILEAVSKKNWSKLGPTFADSTQTQRVLDAAVKSSKTRTWVKTGC